MAYPSGGLQGPYGSNMVINQTPYSSGDMGNFYNNQTTPQNQQIYSQIPSNQNAQYNRPVNSYPVSAPPRFPHTQTVPMPNNYSQPMITPQSNLQFQVPFNYNQMPPMNMTPPQIPYGNPESQNIPYGYEMQPQQNYTQQNPNGQWNKQAENLSNNQEVSSNKTQPTGNPSGGPQEELKFSQFPPEFTEKKCNENKEVAPSNVEKSKKGPNPKSSVPKFVFREPLIPARCEGKRTISKSKLSKQGKCWELRGSKYYGCFTSRTNGLQDICPKVKCPACTTPPKSVKNNK